LEEFQALIVQEWDLLEAHTFAALTISNLAIAKMKTIGTMSPKRVMLMTMLTAKSVASSSLKTELGTRDSGKETCATDMAFKFGQMEQNTKATGRTTKLMATVSFGTCMATNTKENGNETRLMAMESTLTATGLPTKVTGATICNTVEALSSGTITQSMKASTREEKSTAKERTPGKMVLNTPENGMKTEFMDVESTPGTMEGSTRETGKTTTWTAMVCTPGRMVVSTRASIRRTRSMAKASTLGPTEGSTMASGRTADNMVVASTYQRLASSEKGCGKTEREQGG